MLPTAPQGIVIDKLNISVCSVFNLHVIFGYYKFKLTLQWVFWLEIGLQGLTEPPPSPIEILHVEDLMMSNMASKKQYSKDARDGNY